MKWDLKLIATNCAQYNEPRSEIVKMSKDLISSIMESWIDSGLEKLMSYQHKSLKTGKKSKEEIEEEEAKQLLTED